MTLDMEKNKNNKSQNFVSNERKIVGGIRTSKTDREDFLRRENDLKRDDYYFNLQIKLKY